LPQPKQCTSPSISSKIIRGLLGKSRFFYIIVDRDKIESGSKWLVPVILATQEAEIRRFMV
jgi:hypothetical protein